MKISDYSKNFKIFNNNYRVPIKKRYLYTAENIDTNDNSIKLINFSPKNVNDNVGNFTNNILKIKQDLDCIMYVYMTYTWKMTRINKFNIIISCNDKNYTFTGGWDSFINRLNVYNNRMPLKISKDDNVSVSITCYAIPVKIDNIILIFEEI